MRKTKKAIASLAIAGMVLSMAPLSVFGATTDSNRLAGAGRVETAIAIAAEGWTTSDSVIVVPADDANIVDALAAAPLAGQLNAPILVTYKGALDPQVQAEIVKLGAKNVYAVGALSADTVASLKAISGVTVTSLQGADRTDTAAKVAAQLTGVKGSFVVAYEGKADALSAASFAAANDYSIVIANPDGTIPASETVVAPTYTVGGQVSYAGATALAGADRYATNNAVLNGLTFNYDKVYVANGQSLVDALAGAPLAAQTNSPIVLGDAVDVATGANDNLTGTSKVIALGGIGAVSDSVLGKVAYQVPATLAVESVSALNGQQIKVVYNRAVDDSSAENTANTVIYKDGALVGLQSTAIALQSDDLTAIITLPTATANDDSSAYVVTIKDVEAKDDSSMVLPLYSTPVTVKDTTVPTVSTTSAKTNSDTLEHFDVTFSEPISSGVIKIDGTSYGSAATTLADGTVKSSNKVSITGLDLDANVSHTLEVVNLTDSAGNVADTISQSFSVTKDTVAPLIQSLTVKSDSQVEVAFNKKMNKTTIEAASAVTANLAVKTEALDDVADFKVEAKSGDSSDMVYVITILDSTLFNTKTSRTITLVFDDGIEDSLGNSLENNTTNTVVLTKDTVKPTISSITYTTVDSKVTKITATFSENVTAVKAPVVINKDGVQEPADFLDAGVANNNKVTYTLKTAADLTGKYSLVFEGSTVKDKAAAQNGNSAVTKVIDFASGSTATVSLAGKVSASNAATLGTSGAYANVITVTYIEAVKGGAVVGSATDGANYTLDGMSLAGATISLDTDKLVATIKVPAGTLASSTSSAIFTIRNVQNTSGDRYAAYSVPGGLNVVDDTRPVLKSAQVVADTMFLTFSENMELPTTITDLLDSVEVTCGSKTMADSDFSAVTYSLVTGNSKMIQVNLTPALATNWDNDKTITLKTISNSVFADVAGNGIKSDVSVTATK